MTKHIFPVLVFIILLPSVVPSVNSPVAYFDGTYCTVYDVALNITVFDLDNDFMNVSFYWGNYLQEDYEQIVGFCNVTNGNVVAFLPEYWHRQIIVNGATYNVSWLEHDKRYEWFVTVDDGKNTTILQVAFDTCKAWDLNLDKKIGYADISSLILHYGETVMPPGAEPWDINEDGSTNYFDISIIISHYGENY